MEKNGELRSSENLALSEMAIPEVPVTMERIPFAGNLEDAGTARANYAPDVEHPEGTQTDNWRQRHRHQTVSI